MAKTKPTRKKKMGTRSPYIQHANIMPYFPLYCENFFVTFSTSNPDLKITEPKIKESTGRIIPKATHEEWRRLAQTKRLDWQCMSIVFGKNAENVNFVMELKGYTLREAVALITEEGRKDAEALYQVGEVFENEDRFRWGWMLKPSIEKDIVEDYDEFMDYFHQNGILNDELYDLTYQISLLRHQIKMVRPPRKK